MSIRVRSSLAYGMVLLVSALLAGTVATRVSPEERSFAFRILVTALVIPAAWALSHARFLRCGFCGTRYAQQFTDYLVPYPACRTCGVTPGALQTTFPTIDKLLYHRVGLWGLPGEAVAPELRNVMVTDKRRRIPYLRRLRDELDRSFLSRYDRERLIALIDQELRAAEVSDSPGAAMERGAV